jgi:hypothetical protein
MGERVGQKAHNFLVERLTIKYGKNVEISTLGAIAQLGALMVGKR